ncbi:MAG: hypothetical protein FJZ62_04720 [Chlamydiae bacterium]|nr:hypothetical protein [Chlamydiota bacterium]
MIGTFLFFSFLVAEDPKLADNANYPMKEGVYQVQSQTVATPRYPNGITETGTRKVRNETFGQKWVTNTTFVYTDNNNQSFRKTATYETTFFKDFNGQQKVFMLGSQGSYGMGNVTMQKDGTSIQEIDGMSNAVGKMIKSKVVISPTKKGYDAVQTYYDEASKKWLPLRTSTYTFTSPSSN